MSFDTKIHLSFDLNGDWRHGVVERFQLARQRFEDWMRHLGDVPDEDLPIEWETVEWIGGPFDGLQRRIERWKVFNLPAHLELPIHPAQFASLEGRDVDPDPSSEIGPEIDTERPHSKAVYVSAVQGTAFRYRFVGVRARV